MICDLYELAFLRARIVIPRVQLHYSASVTTSMQVTSYINEISEDVLVHDFIGLTPIHGDS